MPALEAAEAEPMRRDWEPYISTLKLLQSKPKYTSKPKRKVAGVLRVFNRHYHRVVLLGYLAPSRPLKLRKIKSSPSGFEAH